jgi:hypothetical protein
LKKKRPPAACRAAFPGSKSLPNKNAVALRPGKVPPLETALLPAPFWCTSRGSVHFDWRWRERPALALLAWKACSRSNDNVMPHAPKHFDLSQNPALGFPSCSRWRSPATKKCDFARQTTICYDFVLTSARANSIGRAAPSYATAGGDTCLNRRLAGDAWLLCRRGRRCRVFRADAPMRPAIAIPRISPPRQSSASCNSDTDSCQNLETPGCGQALGRCLHPIWPALPRFPSMDQSSMEEIPSAASCG